jgi:hypothetical protein
MNRYRQRHPDFGKAVKKAPDSTFGELTDDAEVSDAAESVYTEAEKHREGVKARDAAAKARKKKTRG